MDIIIPGRPIAKHRPRFARRGKFVVTYNDQETEEGKFLLLVREQFKEAPITCPIRLSCGFYMPIPESTSKRKREAMLSEWIRPDKKPDMSNLIKFVEDVLNEIVWADDKQIVSYGAMEKYYSDQPRTHIRIEKLAIPEVLIERPKVKRLDSSAIDGGRVSK